MSEKSDDSRTFNTWIESIKVFKRKKEKRLESFSHHRIQIRRRWLNVIVEIEESTYHVKRSGELDHWRHEDAFVHLDLNELDELTKFLIGLRMDILNDSKDPRYVEAMNEECSRPDTIWTYGKKPQSVKEAFERNRKVYAERRKEPPEEPDGEA